MERKMPIDEITRMGKHRREIVEELVEQAQKKRWTVVQLARRLQVEANTPTMRDNRNWQVVAQTELVDLMARGSLEEIGDRYGRNQKVVRVTQDACPACLHAFGTIDKPKIWHVGMIPEHLMGAVHPSCRCSPWRPFGASTMKKSELDDHHRSHGLAMADSGLLNLPQNPHAAANKKMLLLHKQKHFSTCKVENCPECKKYHESLSEPKIEKAFERQGFVHKMRFVIRHILKPKKVARGL
jgi:hypothetical protein